MIVISVILMARTGVLPRRLPTTVCLLDPTLVKLMFLAAKMVRFVPEMRTGTE